MDSIESYILENNDFHKYDNSDFISFYGKPLEQMVKFGTREVSSHIDFEALKTFINEGNKNFIEEIESMLKQILFTEEVFLISSDIDGNIFLFREVFKSEEISILDFLAQKHKYSFEIAKPALEINLLQIWFYKNN